MEKSKRKRRSVSLKLRRDWLLRFESGEPATDIATNDDYDVRTVRKYIDMAKEERDKTEVHASVLRNALEAHYEDLIKYVVRIDNAVRFKDKGTLEYLENEDIDPLWEALEEHLPRSPVWKSIERLHQLYDRIATLEEKVAIRFTRQIESKFTGVVGVELKQSGLHRCFRDHFITVIDNPNSEAENVVSRKMDDETIQLYYKDRYCANVIVDQEATITQMLMNLLNGAGKLDEVDDMKSASYEINKLTDKVCRELTVIRMKRIVAGKCEYCPI